MPARGLVCAALCLSAGCTSRAAYFSNLGDDLESAVVGELNAAQDSVHVAIYTFTSQPIQDALLNALGRGVAVQVVMDAGQLDDIPDQTAVKVNLSEAGGSVRATLGWNGGLMHDKIAIIDAATVLTGSYNYTPTATTRSDENLVILADPGLAASYEAAFEEIWQRATE